MFSEALKMRALKYHRVPLQLLTLLFYKQAVFVGKLCWIVVFISIAVSLSLSISWLMPKHQTPKDAIKETAHMYAVENGRYHQNAIWVQKRFSDQNNLTKETWPHQKLASDALRVVVVPKPNRSRILFNSAFWSNMRRLCGKVRISYNPIQPLPFNLMTEFFDHYVCSKRDGKCLLPWVCTGGKTRHQNGQPKEEIRPKYASNTKLFGVKYPNGNNNSSYNASRDSLAEESRLIHSAKSFVLYWHHNHNEFSFLWQMKAFKSLQRFRRTLPCCDILPYSSAAYYQEISKSTSNQTGIFIVTVLAMILFLLVVSWKNSFIHSRSTFAFAIILNTFMAVGSGLSLGQILGVPFVTSVAIAPFIILGVGIDSGLIMIRAWACETSSEDPVERTARSVEKSFASIFISDLTSILAFLIGSATPYSAVNFTCRYLVLSLSCLFTAEVTFLTACIVIHNKRVVKEHHCICCWEPVEEGEEQFIFPFYPQVVSKLSSYDSGMEKKIGKVFKLIVSSLKIRLSIIAGTLVLVVFSIYHLAQMPQYLDTAEFIATDSPLQDYLKRDDVTKHVNLPVTFVINQSLAYWEVQTWKQLDKLQNEIYASGYFERDTAIPELNWLQLFRSYFPNSSNKTEFFKDQLPRLFRKHPVIQSDLIFNDGSVSSEDKEIIASRFFLTMPVISGLERPDLAEHFLDTVQQILDQADFEVLMAQLSFNEWEMMMHVRQSTWKSIIVAIFTCSLTVLLLIPEMSVFLCITITTAITIVTSLGMMAAFGLTYNIVTYTQIIVSIGLSVDYMSHAGYSFHIERGEPLQRCEKSLSSMGVALTNAALSSLIGILFLSVSPIYGYKTFFISFATLFTLSLLFGVLFLPVLLSFVAGPRYKEKDGKFYSSQMQSFAASQYSRSAIGEPNTLSDSDDSVFSETQNLIGRDEESLEKYRSRHDVNSNNELTSTQLENTKID